MTFQHYLLKQTTQQFLSPAKVFAKLKSKVQRGDTCAVEAAEKPGADFSSPRKHNGNTWMSDELKDNQRVGSYYTEVEPLTLSPISSPQKRCRYSDRAVLDMSPATGGGQTHTGRGRLESTALSQPSSWVNTGQTCNDPPQIRDLSSRTPVKTQMTDRDRDRSVFVDQADNVFSPIKSRLRKRKHNPPEFYRDFSMTGWKKEEQKSFAQSGNESYYESSVMDPVKQLPVDQSEVTIEPMIPPLKATLKRCTISLEKCPPMSPAKLFALMKEKETNSPKHLHNIKRKLIGKPHQVGDAHLSSSLAVNVSQVFTDSDAPDCRNDTIACKNSVHSRSSGYSSEDVLLSNPPTDRCANYEVFTHKTMLNNGSKKHQAGFNPGDTWTLENQENVSHQNKGQASLTSCLQKRNQIEIPPARPEQIPPSRRGRGTASLESKAMSQPLGIKDLKNFKVSSRMTKNDKLFDESPPLSKHWSEANISSPIKTRLRSRNWQLKDYSRRGESRNEDCRWPKERKLSALREDHFNKTSIEDAGDVGELTVNQSEVTPEPRVPQLGTDVEKRFRESGFPLRSPAKMFSYMKERENKREPQTLHHIRRETFPECEVPPSRDVPVLPAQTEADGEDVTLIAENQSIDSPALIQSDSSSSEEDVLVPAARPKPVLFEDPLVLNSPRISIPKKPEAVFKRNKWPKQVQFPNESVIYLKKWFLRKNNVGLFVEGIHREENISWNSSNITDRVSRSVLKTVSGRVYILVGKMNMDRASDFPRWILNKFAKGFPSNWKDLYEKLLLEPRGKQSTKPKRCSDGGKTGKTPAANISVIQSKKRSIKTPELCSPPSSASQLNVSRSGRVIKAPLEYWKGGRVMLDAHMNVTIHQGYETSMCSPDMSSIVSSSVLKANARVLLPNAADSREKKVTGGKEESVPTRKVKALIHPHSRSSVGTAEKVSKPVELQVEAPRRTKETSGKTSRSNKQSPTTEKQTYVETVPRKGRNAPGKQKAKKQQTRDTDRTTAGASGTKQAKNNTVDPQEQDEEKWTEAELKKLREAVSYYPIHILGYWERVSQMVETRSAEECYKQHAAPETPQTAAKEAKKVQKKKNSKVVVVPKDSDLPVISARAGTLKRKQQVRQYLDTMPRDNVDDVFSSAYMQNKRAEMPSLCPSEDHDLSMSDMEPVTPKSNGYPQVKTPQCLYITPGMMGSPNRSIDDKCVYQLQKRMKKNRFNVNKYSATAKNFPTTPSVRQTMKRCSNADMSFVVWEMFTGNDAAQSDSGEEEDVYFSEND